MSKYSPLHQSTLRNGGSLNYASRATRSKRPLIWPAARVRSREYGPCAKAGSSRGFGCVSCACCPQPDSGQRNTESLRKIRGFIECIPRACHRNSPSPLRWPRGGLARVPTGFFCAAGRPPITYSKNKKSGLNAAVSIFSFYRLGFPREGLWRVRFNSDWQRLRCRLR